MTALAREYGHGILARRDRLPNGLDALADNLAGMVRRRLFGLKVLGRMADGVMAAMAELAPLSDAALAQRMADASAAIARSTRLGRRERLARDAAALAVVGEVAARSLGMRPYKVQIIGALAIASGNAAELATGEGKTLVVGLAAVLAAWTRRPCHVVTANDYLAARDADLMRPLYDACDVSVGHIASAMDPRTRRWSYNCDVVYGTSQQLTADFLRDQLALGGILDPDRRLIRRLGGDVTPAQPVMRGLHTAIVDEADSVLIDEAVTPLIIAVPRQGKDLHEASSIADTIARALVAGSDYRLDEQARLLELTQAGELRIETLGRALPPLWRGKARREELVRQALTAHHFYQRDHHYVIRDDKVVIVDDLTGRFMEGRSWSYGLHQAVEAKEGVPITDQTAPQARLSFQGFFRLYRRLGGVSGTLQRVEREMWRVYRLGVVRVPRRLPSKRQYLPARVLPDTAAKFDAVEQEILRVHGEGRPILVGTRTIGASEALAARLAARGIPCQVLNALHEKEEAAIIAAAGEPGSITIATNMAGRGTDIRVPDAIRALGGLHLITTEANEAQRVDWQLYGRVARQGDPGSVQPFYSLDDPLLEQGGPAFLRRLLERHLARPHGTRLALLVFTLVQRRVEARAYAGRRMVLRMDDWQEKSLAFAGA
jgi:preprotein translocase subunit SecA